MLFYGLFISVHTLLLLRTFRQPRRTFYPVALNLSFIMQTQDFSDSVSNILFTLSTDLHVCICAVLRFIHALFDIKLALVFVKKNVLLKTSLYSKVSLHFPVPLGPLILQVCYKWGSGMRHHQRPFAKSLTKFFSLSSVLPKAEVSGSNN
jgi:hypothetical protein